MSALETSQVTVATTATLVAAVRKNRRSVTIENHGTTPIYIGRSNVTTANGALLPGVLGASITLETADAIYGIVASGTQAVSVIELV